MKRKTQHKKMILSGLLMITILSNVAFGGRTEMGTVAIKVSEMASRNLFSKEIEPFKIAANRSKQIDQDVNDAIVLEKTEQLNVVLTEQPEYVKVNLPTNNNTGSLTLLLYKVNISPGGLTVLTSDGKSQESLTRIVHYRGIIEGEPMSLAAFTFSDNETMALISGSMGNLVLGKEAAKNSNGYIIYNDKDIKAPFHSECAANTNLPGGEENNKLPESILTTKCVNWYYEIDYDLFLNKGSVANVNSYIQGIFNQVSTLYANDGISITLGTIYVWTETDPYTGPTTTDYLNQFGAYRTSFSGDLANLVGTQGGGGIAWVNGLCNGQPKYKMGYMGISTSYNSVPVYSWTVEVITHEDGHLLGSRHTHDCAWNGNSTPIDGCGPAAGYTSGTCAAGPLPVKGTIMSYCHLLSSIGIEFNLGFGPQPTSLIISNINNATCLQTCGGCVVPVQPGVISGNTTTCQGTSETYSIAAVPTATSYSWVIPVGWSGTSTGNSITVTPGSTGGSISVFANNSCGSSQATALVVSTNALPAIPGAITVSGGTAKICPGETRIYTVPVSTGATFNWTVPTGSVINYGQGTNSISVTYDSGFTSGGTLSVVQSNACGNSGASTLTITKNTIATPGPMTGTAAGLCGLTNVIYSVPAVSGMTYNWAVPVSVTIVGGQGTNSLNVDFGSTSVSGDISVKAVNGCGTSAVRKKTVKTAPPTPGTISGNVTVCSNSSGNVYSIAPVFNATEYVWTGPSNSLITANGITSAKNILTTTSSSVSVSFATVTSSSKLMVRATNACGTSGTKTLALASGSCKGEGNAAINSGLTLYPNPTYGNVTLSFESPLFTTGNLNIIDITGRTVYSSIKSLNEGINVIELNIKDLSPGIYIVKLEESGEVFTRKLEIR